jgi:hypothetical protein
LTAREIEALETTGTRERMSTTPEIELTAATEGIAALGRLIRVAMRDTGQSRRVADFLMAWHNAEENGGWDPTDLWSVDTAIALDILATLKMLRCTRRYPGDFGCRQEMERIWELWRSPLKAKVSGK